MSQVQNVAGQVHNEGPRSSGNLADEIQALMSRVAAKDPFVKTVHIGSGRTPAVYLYTQEQIEDIRLLCSRESPDFVRSVLSVNRTFNLSSLYVTVLVFKNRKVVRRRTQ